MIRTHQPGQAVFRSVLPEDIDWKQFPAFPPSVRLAVVIGEPSEPGPYVIRGQSALGGEADAAPTSGGPSLHSHVGRLLHRPGRSVRWRQGEGVPPGSVIVLPGDTPHFHWAKSGEYITQVTADGPLGLDYLNAKDDPRNKSS